MRQRGKMKTVTNKMSTAPRTAPPEVWKEIDAELDDYINQWKEALRKHLEAKGYRRKAGGKRRRKPQPQR